MYSQYNAKGGGSVLIDDEIILSVQEKSPFPVVVIYLDDRKVLR
jgi:hypothetical protein